MLSFTELRIMARARVDDAKALLAAGRYDGAVYLVGYAIEYALKARIATSLFASRGFPDTAEEFERLAKIKSHKLNELLKFSGRATKIYSGTRKMEWDYLVANWSPEARYLKFGSADGVKAMEMIEAVEKLLKVL